MPDPVKRLTKFLLISGILNILLVAAFFYWYVKEAPPRPYFESKPADKSEQFPQIAMSENSTQLIHQLKLLSFEQLLTKLNETQLVENGYNQRDFVLASLVAFHHFDLERALKGSNVTLQPRRIVYGKTKHGAPAYVLIYSGLTDEVYQNLIRFANAEKWPLTSRGLFNLVKKQNTTPDVSLVNTFMQTPEFLAVETLFNHSGVSIDKNSLVNILREGTWQILSSFYEQQKIAQELSPTRRQHFLLNYIKKHSRAAAYVLLKTDAAFAAKKLDNQDISTILSLLDHKTLEAEKFATLLLISPRNDHVWQLAAQKLYEFAGEPLPQTNLHHAALARFLRIPARNMPVQTTVTREIQPSNIAMNRSIAVMGNHRIYVVQDGDSLWKIARRFKIDTEKLKEYNKLKSDFLKPGSTLKIPAKP